MKWLPTQVGAEPKKLIALAVLVALAGGAYWYESGPSGGPSVSATVKTPANPPPIKTMPSEIEAISRASVSKDSGPMPFKRAGGSGSPNRGTQDFRPSMKPPEDFDVSAVDPAIHWDLLAKVREVRQSGGSRSLFEFGKAPEPPPPPVQPIKPVTAPPPPPPPVVTTSTEPPKPPPPPPIPLKYYGFTGKGRDRGMFLDGDPLTGVIFVVSPEETVKNRYKIIRLGLTSAVVEDTVTMNQQTLPMVEDVAQ